MSQEQDGQKCKRPVKPHVRKPWSFASRTSVATLSMVAALSIVAVAGCGTATSSNQVGGSNGTQNTSAGKQANPPFRNRLKDMPATPDPNFDPTAAKGKVYNDITVYKADGTKVVLDATKTPILFEAYWCPHCQRTLNLLNQNRDKLTQFPVLVSMGFAPGTPLTEAVQISKQEMDYFHITNVQEYYYLGSQTNALVPEGYPTMAFPGQGGVLTMAGEHTLQAWEQALKSQ